MTTNAQIKQDLNALTELFDDVAETALKIEVLLLQELVSDLASTLAGMQSRWSSNDSRDLNPQSHPLDLGELRKRLERLNSTFGQLQFDAESGGPVTSTPMESGPDYFPHRHEPRQDILDDDVAAANREWEKASERGRRHRDQALAPIGPVLTPREVAQRLGVSTVTVKNWRQQNKLLGVKFDDHQFLYPVFQFANTPTDGGNGVLRHFADILGALPFESAWPKAHFFVSPLPVLRGRAPIAILREISADALQSISSVDKRDDQLEHLRQVARHAGEMGS